MKVGKKKSVNLVVRAGKVKYRFFSSLTKVIGVWVIISPKILRSGVIIAISNVFSPHQSKSES